MSRVTAVQSAAKTRRSSRRFFSVYTQIHRTRLLLLPPPGPSSLSLSLYCRLPSPPLSVFHHTQGTTLCRTEERRKGKTGREGKRGVGGRREEKKVVRSATRQRTTRPASMGSASKIPAGARSCFFSRHTTTHTVAAASPS